MGLTSLNILLTGNKRLKTEPTYKIQISVYVTSKCCTFQVVPTLTKM